MNNITSIIFIILNTGLTCYIFMWLIRYRLIPFLRTKLAIQDEQFQTLTHAITQQQSEVTNEMAVYEQQKYLIARLTLCMEQWTGTLAQRAVLADQEYRERVLRYREQCADNARLYTTHHTQRTIIKQTIKNARALLVQEYSNPYKQNEYIYRVCNSMQKKDI